MATRRIKRSTRRSAKSEARYARNRGTRRTTRHGKRHTQHHHFLLRMETKYCPLEANKDKARDLISYIIRDIDMKLLAAPHVYYVKYPRYNEGLTAIAPIQTSHIAFHFWKSPDRKILHNAESKCLLQLDIYTCGSLTLNHIHKILHHLSRFEPTHVNATLLNRNYSLTLERQLMWDLGEKIEWTKWVDSIPAM